jgi:hypothetical protein
MNNKIISSIISIAAVFGVLQNVELTKIAQAESTPTTTISVADNSVVADPVTITFVVPVASVNADKSLGLGALPTNILVNLSNGMTYQASNVSWDSGTPTYNGDVDGTYTFSGTLTAPDGSDYTNPNNLKANVDLILTGSSAGDEGSTTPPLSTPTTTPIVSPATVNLGVAGNFVILAKSGVSVTGTASVVGDIGASPIAATGITGFGLILDHSGVFSTSALVTGNIFAADYTDPTPANLTTAVLNMQAAYTDGAGRAPDVTELGAGNIGGMTLAPGVYKWTTGLSIPTDVTLSGGANDVWIFQVAQTLIVNSSAKIVLSGGAKANNIFWVVTGQTTIGTSAVFDGNILDRTAVVLDTSAQLNGRALAQTAVTLDSNAVTIPPDSVTIPNPTNTGVNGGDEGSTTPPIIPVNQGSNGNEDGTTTVDEGSTTPPIIPVNQGSNGDENSTTTVVATTTPATSTTTPATEIKNNAEVSSSPSSSSGSFYGGFSTPPLASSALATTPSSLTETFCPLLTSYMRLNGNNDGTQVAKLQAFLKNNQDLNVDVTGIFDQKTDAAVRAFQTKYVSDTMGPWGVTLPSGYVYITTSKKINQISCDTPLTLSSSDMAIINAYKGQQTRNSQGTQGNNTTGLIVPPSEQNATSTSNATTTPITPQIGLNTDIGLANTASVANASVLQRMWDFIKNIF